MGETGEYAGLTDLKRWLFLNDVKDVFQGFVKEPSYFQGQQSRRHEFSLFYGENGLPGHADDFGQGFLRHVVMVEPAAFDMISQFHHYILSMKDPDRLNTSIFLKIYQCEYREEHDRHEEINRKPHGAAQGFC